MSVRLLQFAGGLVTPEDDAYFYDWMINQTGVLQGLAVTSLGANQLHVADGRALILGREVIAEAETLLATVSPSGAIPGRLLLRIDLNNTSAPVQFVTQAASPLPSLTQEDLNNGGAVYELPLVTYSISETTVTGLAAAFTQLVSHVDNSVAHTTQTDKNKIAGAVQNTVKVNGHALTGNVTVTAADAGAAPVGHVGDSTHITGIERTAWNGKAEKSTVSTASLTTAGWAGSAAPYTQAVTVAGILATDTPEIGPVYDADAATRAAQHTAWNAVTMAVATAGTITFTCDEDKPTTAIPIQIKVVR